MSILINMEMPKNCLECVFYRRTDPVYDYCCISSATPKGYVPNDCPLIEVPPHGRLIEAEPIMKFITDGLNSGEFGYDQIKVLTEIQYAPTVIPADKDGET